MKRFIASGLTFFALLLLLAGIAAAQGATVTGQVIDLQGKPFANVAVTIKNDSGRTFNTKTDKNGNFVQVGVPDGTYTVTLTSPSLPQPFSTQFQQNSSSPKPWDINLKEIAGSAGAAADAAAKAFAGMKAHFDTATAAMNDGDALRKQVPSAPPDQKADLTSKMNADYQTALTEYTAAEQGINAKDVGNHALIWDDMGTVDADMGKYDDAVASFQKAIDLKPMPGYFADMSTAIANQGAAQHDPAVLQQKISDASAACDKAAAASSAAPGANGAPAAPAGGAAPVAGASAATTVARCYKNIGIVLTNKGDDQQAVDPLKKASDGLPNDPQVWFELGSAYAGSVQTKTVGDKETYTFDPETGPALQKCISLDANGPLGAQCKEILDGVNTMGAGISTTVGTPPAKKKK